MRFKIGLVIMAMWLAATTTAFGEELHWVRFSLFKTPHYDPRTGEILRDITGRKNTHRDPFVSGHWIYPDLSGLTVIERRERNGVLLIKLAITRTELDKLVTRDDQREIVATFKVRRTRTKFKRYVRGTMAYNFQKFQPAIVSANEAEIILHRWGIRSIPVESGVTN